MYSLYRTLYSYVCIFVELFNDDQVANKILESTDPKVQKELGRRVRNFDPSVWSDHCDDIVKLANYIKVYTCIVHVMLHNIYTLLLIFPKYRTIQNF